MLLGYESEPQKQPTSSIFQATKPIRKTCKNVYSRIKRVRMKKCQNKLKGLLPKTGEGGNAFIALTPPEAAEATLTSR